MDRGLPVTRRTLLAAGGAGVVTLVGGGLVRGPGGLPAVGPATVPVRSMFTPHVGSTFTLRGEDGRRVRTRLVSVDDLQRAARGDEDAFGLLLHAPEGERLDQTVARLEHPSIRTIPLLVSPAGTGARGQDYAIVVNRHSSPKL
jgi:hypothetical protein